MASVFQQQPSPFTPLRTTSGVAPGAWSQSDDRLKAMEDLRIQEERRRELQKAEMERQQRDIVEQARLQQEAQAKQLAQEQMLDQHNPRTPSGLPLQHQNNPPAAVPGLWERMKGWGANVDNEKLAGALGGASQAYAGSLPSQQEERPPTAGPMLGGRGGAALEPVPAGPIEAQEAPSEDSMLRNMLIGLDPVTLRKFFQALQLSGGQEG